MPQIRATPIILWNGFGSICSAMFQIGINFVGWKVRNIKKHKAEE